MALMKAVFMLKNDNNHQIKRQISPENHVQLATVT